MTENEYLELVDEVIKEGPYKDTWESLCAYKVPEWYKNAKFGIFIHWGVYSVPAFVNEWYPRNMYLKGSQEYDHHRKTFGDHKTFGYKDFIPMFRGEQFDAGKWMELFREAGAKYVMPVAEHHDGFQMYESDLSKWNARNMGPCRDVVGELKEAADKEGIVFALSNHRAEHCWFFNGGREFDSDVNDPKNEEFYWKQQDGGLEYSHDIYSVQPTKEHCENWLARVCEMVEKYRPKIVWFDWWIHNMGFKLYLKRFAAYYYNRAIKWGTEVAINYKFDAFAYGTAVFDVERGQLENIRPRLWQTDTAVAKNSWGYTENNNFKNPVDIVCDLIDIVSKNGCLLLNVGPKPDGTFTEEDRNILLSIGRWLKVNGEGIYDTTYWKQYGEGPTKVHEGAFTDVNRAPFTPQDIRFTYKNGVIYAFVMKFPTEGKIEIKALRRVPEHEGNFDIKSVSVMGNDTGVTFERNTERLAINVEEEIKSDYPVCLKIVID
jgi:Alpha-L-fucosidase